MKNINIVLVEPEIPQNTGNIARTCACTGAKLHLVKPFGFEITDKHLKRAGLDYWSDVDITYYDNLEDFLKKHKDDNLLFLTTKGKHRYSDMKFHDGDYLLFGKETKGLPEELLHNNYEKCLRVPMKPTMRSLNLSNTVCLVTYEVLRQFDFEGLEDMGHLTKFND